jgi:hypothetical protein
MVTPFGIFDFGKYLPLLPDYLIGWWADESTPGLKPVSGPPI